MRHGAIAGIVALSIGVSAPVAAQSSGQLLKGGAIGAGAGAVAGALLPGASVGAGALIGGAGGLAYTALTRHRGHDRDDHERIYYVSKNGARPSR